MIVIVVDGGAARTMHSRVAGLARAGLAVPRRYGTSPLQGVASGLGLFLVLVALVVLLGGPDPVRGTRWFWFWVGQLPYGLGFLAWLAVERPWSANPPSAPPRSGWLGLAFLLALGFLVLIVGSFIDSWLSPG